MLENIHRKWYVSTVYVRILLCEGKAFVVAGAKVKTNALMLPPCVPQSNKVMDITKEHPFVVQVSVCLTDNADAQTRGDKTFERKVDLLLWPEFKTPTAVAASSGSADKGASAGGRAEADGWEDESGKGGEAGRDSDKASNKQRTGRR